MSKAVGRAVPERPGPFPLGHGACHPNKSPACAAHSATQPVNVRWSRSCGRVAQGLLGFCGRDRRPLTSRRRSHPSRVTDGLGAAMVCALKKGLTMETVLSLLISAGIIAFGVWVVTATITAGWPWTLMGLTCRYRGINQPL